MSKGNPVIHCRINQSTLDAMQEQINMSFSTRRAGPFTQSSFVELAIIEKVRKMRRSRGEDGGGRGEEEVRDTVGDANVSQRLLDFAVKMELLDHAPGGQS